MKRTSRKLAAVLGVVALTTTACGSQRDDGGGDAPDTAATGTAGDGQDGTDGGGNGEQAASCPEDVPGVTEDTIKVGGIYPLSGPASAYGVIRDGAQAFFDYANAELSDALDGRQIEFVVRDDSYSPPKAIEAARALIEQEQVFALFNTLGTPSNTAIWDYTNEQGVPQVYVATGASKFGTDPDGQHSWTIGWQPNYVSEARVYAAYLEENAPEAKVAVLFQNDDFGEDLKGGFEEAIADSDVEIVAEASYEVTDPSIESQMTNLAQSGADTLLNITTPKFGAQALAFDAQSDWDPLHIVNNVAASTTVMGGVGWENVQGVISATYFIDPTDPEFEDTEQVQEFMQRIEEYAPGVDVANSFIPYGWNAANTFYEALSTADCLSREGLMDSVRNMDTELPMLIPGVRVTTAEDDPFPIESMQVMEARDDRWVLIGDVIDTRAEYGPVKSDE